MRPGRLHTLVDGVFAIAMTLLVLDLPRPEVSRLVAHDLEVRWDAYVAYLVSFATLGILWMEHHEMMSAVVITTRRFIERTLVFLLFVAAVPWPTALAAQFADEPRAARLVAALYSATMLLLSLALAWNWAYLTKHTRLVAEPARDALPAAYRRSILVPLPYLIAVGVAFVSPIASLVIDALTVTFYAATRSHISDLVEQASTSNE
ncbi:MAG: TMEM175 family protein [Acidimicrobiales bacterium]